jgi:hypothetical protein
MSDKLSLTDHNKDPKAEFQAALETLNEFNQRSENSSQSPFTGLMRMVVEKFSENSQMARKKQEELLRKAIQTLKRNYALIPKLEEGSLQEQSLASFARIVIHNFNANIDKANKHDTRSVKEKITSSLTINHVFLKQIERIELPGNNSIHVDFLEKEKIYSYKKISPSILSPYTAASSEKISRLPQIHSTSSPLPKQLVPYLSWQAVQLFYMKVISLIEKHRVLSHLEARHLIRNASLDTTLDSKLNICIATCAMSPFPGHTITVTGAFNKDPKSQIYNIPSKEHPFHLAITSTQNGFPHPSQLGWALPDMTPQYPQRLNELPTFKGLYQSKQIISQALHPNERLLEKAKKQLEFKLKAFNENREMMIDLHQTLSVAIAEAATNNTLVLNSNHPICSFYTRLKQIHHPYDYLSNTHNLINEMYFKRCYDKLQNAWFEGLVADNKEADKGENLKACRQILTCEYLKINEELRQQRLNASSELEKCTIDFILFMGKNLQPWHEIILQQFSEIASFSPPELSFYLEKIQVMAYRQLTAFICDSEQDLFNEAEKNIQIAYHQMKESLESDIRILRAASANDFDAFFQSHQISQELKKYYG